VAGVQVSLQLQIHDSDAFPARDLILPF
jgi:hypothetical protein